VKLNSIDLTVGHRLRDREFRREWFRAELESAVPELFRDLRELRGLTQSDLADLADMKQSAVSRFESSSEATWKLETLLRLADALDAQLSISLEPAESVIGRYANERIGGGGTPPKSVLDASKFSHEQAGRTATSDSLVSVEWFDRPNRYRGAAQRQSENRKGDRPWN
jgi:transcriptional regulator with XRE-family HTH domain